MCVVSMVFDDYAKRDEWPWHSKPSAVPWTPAPNTNDLDGLQIVSKSEIAELRKLIAEFREAVEAAKTVDRLTGQPDCEDPDKAKLEERVSELERRLNAMTTAGLRTASDE